jgi:hypothetical protein
MRNDKYADTWVVRIPRRLRASVDKIALEQDRHPASVVRRILIRALAQHAEQRSAEQPPQ